jgi:hypothetical protein
MVKNCININNYNGWPPLKFKIWRSSSATAKNVIIYICIKMTGIIMLLCNVYYPLWPILKSDMRFF